MARIRKGEFVIKILAYVSVVFCSTCTVFGQVPEFENSEDCLDWFLISWNALNNKSACFGNAHVSGSSSEGFVELDWFEFRFNDSATRKSYRYVESRQTFANGEQADLWERLLIRGNDFKASLGSKSRALDKVKPPEFDSQGKQTAGHIKYMNIPDVCAFSVGTGSMYDSEFGSHSDLSKMFDQLKLNVIESDVEGEKFKGFYHGGGKYAVEISFDKRFGGMPVECRGFFRDKKKNGVPDRTFFSPVNFESETKWEQVGKSGRYAPVAITNFVQRLNPISKNSKMVEIRAAWELDGVDASVFSDESIENDRMEEGPLFALRKTLKAKLDNSKK